MHNSEKVYVRKGILQLSSVLSYVNYLTASQQLWEAGGTKNGL